MQTLDLTKLRHQKGNHCGSSSLRDIFRYGGYEVSEAMVFGLACGLGFIYIPGLRMVNGRSMTLESDFFSLQGQELKWEGRWDPKAMAQALALDRPVLALTDIYHLPYYDATHFPGHSLVVVGIDLDKGLALLADVIDDGFKEVPLGALKAAMETDFPGFMSPYSWCGIARFPLRQDRSTLTQAILKVIHRMIDGTSPFEGIAAMESLAESLPNWPKEEGWAQAARFAYQTIEKRGTGGGAFRLMYADFLQEASRALPELAFLKAPERMRQAGEGWQELAQVFKSVSLNQDPTGLREAAAKVTVLAKTEARLYQDLKTALNPNPSSLKPSSNNLLRSIEHSG